MSHEHSIDITIGGRHFLIPTVVNGKRVKDEEAIRLFEQGMLRPLGMYSTQAETTREARKRSTIATGAIHR